MFLETLRRVYPELTRGQQILAEYLVQNYRQAAFMTAARVAEAVSMNEATVVRFAQRLGYHGYPALQEAIQEAVLAELEKPATPSPLTGSADLFEQLLCNASAGLQNLASLVPREQVVEAVAMLAAADHAAIVSAGEGIPLGQHLARRLRSLGVRTCTVTANAADLAQALADIEPGTLLVACAGVQGSRRMAKAFQIARQAGARTLALAHSPLAPEAHAADVALAPPPNEGVGGSSLVVLVAMADALIEAAAATMPRVETYRQQTRLLEKELE